MKFECPKCHIKSKLSKQLHASWQCPKCRAQMVIQDRSAAAGHMVDIPTKMSKIIPIANVSIKHKPIKAK